MRIPRAADRRRSPLFFAWLLVFAVATLAVAAPPSAAAPRTARVAPGVDGLNLRGAPNAEAPVLALVPAAADLELRLDEAQAVADEAGGGRWWPVRYDGQNGWANGRFLDLNGWGFGAHDDAVVRSDDGSGANLRARPDAASERLGGLGHGAAVTILDGPEEDAAGNAWYRVAAGALEGFVRADLLAARAAPARASFAFAAADVGPVPILMYHNVNYSGNRYSVTPEQLAAQCAWLRDNGYTAIALWQLIDAALNGAMLPAKPVVFTVDDGWASALTFADILGEYGFVGNFFVNNASELTPDQVAYLGDVGEVEAHTANHPMMSQLPYARQYAEIADNRAYLERVTGLPVEYLAWPYGDSNASAVQAAIDAGIVAAFDAGGGPADLLNLDRYHIPRIEIASFHDLDAFAARVTATRFVNEEPA